MRRKSNWLEELNTFIDTCRDQDFSFGQHDCCLFTCNAIEKMTGVDLAEDFRGYKEKREVVAILNLYRDDVKTIAEEAAKKHKLKENGNKINRGDMVLLKNRNRNILGIYGSQGKVYCATESGIGMLDNSSIIKSWGIPF